MQAKLIEIQQLPTSVNNLSYNPSKKRESIHITDEVELKSDSINTDDKHDKCELPLTMTPQDETETNVQAEKPAAKRVKYSIFPNLNEKLLTKIKKEPKTVVNKAANQTAPDMSNTNRTTSHPKLTQAKSEPIVLTNKPSSTETNNNNNNQQKTFACLRNLGSTCYINCIIQVMRYTPGFVLSIHRLNRQIDHLKSLNISELDSELAKNNDITFVRNLHELLVEMSDKERLDRRPIYTPRKFVNTVWQSLCFWSDGSQQDAHEFLQYTIHFINECDLFIRKLYQKYQVKMSSVASSMATIRITTQTNVNQLEKVSNDEHFLFKCKSEPNFDKHPVSTNHQSNKSMTNKLLKSETSANLTSNTSNSFRRTPTKGGANSHPISKKDLAEIGEEELMFEKPYEMKEENDEKDLVSRRLKETLLKSPVIVKPHLKRTHLKQQPAIPNPTKNWDKHTHEEKNSRKKLKRDEVLAQQMSADSDSFIIIMDSDEDDEIYLDETKPTLRNEPSQKQEQEPVDIKEQFKPNESESPRKDGFVVTKKCHVLIEKCNVNDMLMKNHVSLYQPKEEEKVCNQMSITRYLQRTVRQKSPKKNSEFQTNELKTSTRSATNRLKAKAKTFPPFESHQTNLATNPYNSSDLASNANLIEDLNAITVIESVKIALETNVSFANEGSSRTSKTTSNRKKSPIKSTFVNQSHPVETNIAQTTKSSSAMASSAPPSPAELLRKHLTGYTCEMDKLFKGSSITMTQCLECENLRTCPESFYDRSIPIDTNGDDDETNWISKCLRNESYLDGDSKYMCDACKAKQIAKIHTQYTQMPTILVLHLLSYGITSSVNGNLNAQKINNRSRLVSYFDFVCTKSAVKSLKPAAQSLSSPITSRTKCSNQPQNQQQHDGSNDLNQFKLFAVVMHSGVSLNSGHYTAYINYKIILEHEISNSQKTKWQNSETTLISSMSEELCSCHQMETISNSNDCNSNDSFNSSTTTTNSSQNSLNNSPEWLHFDDTKVKMLSNIEFHRKVVDSKFDSPYILFYVKD